MTTFGTVQDPATVRYRAAESSDAADLRGRVAAIIAEVSALTPAHRITAMTLAGAGDGNIFLVEVEFAPATQVTGGLVPTQVLVTTFSASDAAELMRSRATAVPPGPIADVQVVGSSNGHKFMGLVVDAPGAAEAVEQTIWIVDPIAGDDNNTGLSDTEALLTFDEIERRVGTSPVFPQSVTIEYLSDMPKGLCLRGAVVIGPGYLTVRGRPTTLASGTLTGATAYANTGTAADISSAIVGGFAPFEGKRIRIVGGPRDGAIAWIAKETAPGVARTTPFTTYTPNAGSTIPTKVVPLAGDAFAIEELPVIPTINLDLVRAPSATASFGDASAVVFESVRLAEPNTFGSGPTFSPGSALGFEFWKSDLQPASAGAFPFGSYFSSSLLYLNASRIAVPASWNALGNINYCLVDGLVATATFNATSSNAFLRGCLFQDCGLFIANGGTSVYIDGLGIFGATGDAVSVGAGGRLLAGSSGAGAGRIFGSGNGGDGAQASSASVITYAAALPPTVTGSAPGVNDFNVVGTLGAWAAVPVTATITTHLAGIVPQV